MSIYDDTPSHGRTLSYTEASKKEWGPWCLRAIAEGLYWKVTEDYRQIGNYVFVKPETQAKMAQVILGELKAAIAELPDPETCSASHCGDGSRCDIAAKIMMLRFKAESKFSEAITKPQPEISEAEQKLPAPEPQAPQEPEIDESKLTGAQKLARAKAETAGMLPSFNATRES
jgi:hypothetical protein